MAGDKPRPSRIERRWFRTNEPLAIVAASRNVRRGSLPSASAEEHLEQARRASIGLRRCGASTLRLLGGRCRVAGGGCAARLARAAGFGGVAFRGPRARRLGGVFPGGGG